MVQKAETGNINQWNIDSVTHFIALPDTPVRITIEAILSGVERVTARGIPAIRQAQNMAFDKLGEVEGLHLREIREYWDDDRENYRCAEFALGRTSEELEDIWSNPAKYMEDNGYKLVMEGMLQEGDIALYAKDDPITGNPFLVHVGVCLLNGNILSKFGASHIVEHALDFVPIGYGNKVYVYRLQP